MESGLTKEIDSSTDENLIITRNSVDKYIVKFKMTCSQDERNDMVIKVFALIQKKYIAPNEAHFETKKKVLINTITKSYVGSVKFGKPNIH